MKKKYLITGCSGFIGFHLTLRMLKDGYIVVGIDNMNNYYDLKLKNDRLKILLSYKNFFFKTHPEKIISNANNVIYSSGVVKNLNDYKYYLEKKKNISKPYKSLINLNSI